MILAQLTTTIDLPNTRAFLLTRFTDDPGNRTGSEVWSIAVAPHENGLYSIQFVAPEAPIDNLGPESTIPLWRGPNYVGHAKIVNITA